VFYNSIAMVYVEGAEVGDSADTIMNELRRQQQFQQQQADRQEHYMNSREDGSPDRSTTAAGGAGGGGANESDAAEGGSCTTKGCRYVFKHLTILISPGHPMDIKQMQKMLILPRQALDYWGIVENLQLFTNEVILNDSKNKQGPPSDHEHELVLRLPRLDRGRTEARGTQSSW
jgi:hypothetical protein